MITPVIDGGSALAAKLDALPEVIRAALVNEAGRLGRVRHRFRPPGGRTAGVPPAISAAIATALQQVLNR